MCDIRSKFFNDIGQPRVFSIAMSSASQPALLQSSAHSIRKVGFGIAQGSMGLVHEAFILLLYSLEVVLSQFRHSFPSKDNSVELSYQWNKFKLLQLVLENSLLLPMFIPELFSVHAIHTGDFDALSINLGIHNRDELPYLHHNSIDYLRITIHLQIPLPTQPNILTQHISPRNPNVIHPQIPIILGKETKFRTNIPTLYPRQWLIILIPYLNEEGKHSQLPILHYQPGEHHSVIGEYP